MAPGRRGHIQVKPISVPIFPKTAYVAFRQLENLGLEDQLLAGIME